MRKNKLSREDFCRLNNCSDEDYMIVEAITRSILETVVPVQLEEEIPDLAEPGDKVKLFMLLGASAKLKTLWTKNKDPFEQKMREQFATYFKHVDNKLDSTVKSSYEGDEETDIVLLTNDERDKLLYRVWCREADVLKRAFKKGEDASPLKRRTTVKGPAPPKAMKTTRLPNVARLNRRALRLGGRAGRYQPENKKTKICVPVLICA